METTQTLDVPMIATSKHGRLAVNTEVDTNAHLSVQADTILFSHDTTSGLGRTCQNGP